MCNGYEKRPSLSPSNESGSTSDLDMLCFMQQATAPDVPTILVLCSSYCSNGLFLAQDGNQIT